VFVMWAPMFMVFVLSFASAGIVVDRTLHIFDPSEREDFAAQAVQHGFVVVNPSDSSNNNVRALNLAKTPSSDESWLETLPSSRVAVLSSNSMMMTRKRSGGGRGEFRNYNRGIR
jgi:hypothetical protein